jgi:cell wall-associated NlpC family hydrolase
MSLSRRPIAAVATIVVALGGVLGVGPAWADPSTPPSADDVRSAQRSVDAVAGSVAEIEAELADLQMQTGQAQIAVQQAGEAYTQAQAALEAAQADAEAARTESEAARIAAEASRSQLGAVYRAGMQGPGRMGLVSTVVGAGDVQDLVDQDAALRVVGRATRTVVDQSATMQALAVSAMARAEAATDLETERSAQADQALTAAEQAATDLTAQTQAASERREVLLGQLAVAQQTSVDIERERQQAIAAAQAAAQEEATRQLRLAQAPPAAPRVTTPSAPTSPPRTDPAPGPAPKSTPPTTPVAPPTSSGSSATQGQAAVDWARSVLGAPYVWGGTGPGYDCSGLTSRAWASVDVAITRSSRSQYEKVSKIGYGAMRPGDLIFYGTNPSNGSTIYHVAMYIGNGQMIEAPRPGGVVQITAVRWFGTMAYAGRP